MTTILGKHAIVLGGSMAGLLAARVLSDRFERVTMIERDALPEGFGQRKGVPQGRHAHALLARGQHILESFFPDIVAELKAHGAVADGSDVAATGLWHQYGHIKAQFDAGLPGLLLSRPLLEGVVRNRVRYLPNLIIRQNTDAVCLRTTAAPASRACASRTAPRARWLILPLTW
jgi:2-polyprenyl-6-methoxyphenol hydroxylase-like FAD-dependent oxidoreductase